MCSHEPRSRLWASVRLTVRTRGRIKTAESILARACSIGASADTDAWPLRAGRGCGAIHPCGAHRGGAGGHHPAPEDHGAETGGDANGVRPLKNHTSVPTRTIDPTAPGPGSGSSSSGAGLLSRTCRAIARKTLPVRR